MLDTDRKYIKNWRIMKIVKKIKSRAKSKRHLGSVTSVFVDLVLLACW